MSDREVDAGTGIPSSITARGEMIVSVPTLDEVKKATDDRMGGMVKIGYLYIDVREGVLKPIRYYERRLTQIRNVVWHGNSGDISFVGRTADGPERSMLTSFTYYQVEVKWDVPSSTMCIIPNPNR